VGGLTLGLAKAFLPGILPLLASKEAKLNKPRKRVSFRVCEIRCHLEGATGRRRYFVRTPLPHELTLLQEVDRHVETHNHAGTKAARAQVHLQGGAGRHSQT
jgi:hypothetical protein